MPFNFFGATLTSLAYTHFGRLGSYAPVVNVQLRSELVRRRSVYILIAFLSAISPQPSTNRLILSMSRVLPMRIATRALAESFMESISSKVASLTMLI